MDHTYRNIQHTVSNCLKYFPLHPTKSPPSQLSTTNSPIELFIVSKQIAPIHHPSPPTLVSNHTQDQHWKACLCLLFSVFFTEMNSQRPKYLFGK